MKYTTYNKGFGLINSYVELCKEKYNTVPEITIGKIKPTHFNDMEAHVVEFTVTIKKFTIHNNPTSYVKGHRFVIVTNTTYMPDDCETLEEWRDLLNYTLELE